MSSPEQLRLGHGSRMEAREKVDEILQCMRHLATYLDGDEASREPMEYWYARACKKLGKLAWALHEEEAWSDE